MGKAKTSEVLLTHSIVMKPMEGNHGKGPCIVMGKYFTSVGIFEELVGNGIYATRTIHSRMHSQYKEPSVISA
jgi:hypothetical protein